MQVLQEPLQKTVPMHKKDIRKAFLNQIFRY